MNIQEKYLPDDIWVHQTAKLLNHVNTRPHRYDYFSLLRQLESVHQALYGKLGKAVSPKQEKIRVVQEPSLTFQAQSIQSVQVFPSHIEISLNGFGLFGTHAPLPLYLTEYAYERKHQYGDGSWVGFANIFQHRLAILFYRAWANAQSITALDKGADDGFGRFIASFNGFNYPLNFKQPESIHPYTLRYFAGLLMHQGRSAANFQDLLSRYFAVPVRICSNTGCWINAPLSEQTAVGHCSLPLGEGLLLGSRLYDVSSSFRIVVGPLDLAGYRSFFKGRTNAKRLTEWVQAFVGIEYEWDVQPVLAQEEVPLFQLNGKNQLGLTIWLGAVKQDADDLTIRYH